jgi:hypothetical protein
MSIVAVTSTNSATPETVYTGSSRIVRCYNPDASITIHVMDPQCTSPGKFADIPPGQDHVFVRSGSVAGSISAYADSGSPNLIVNEMGGRGA